MKNNFDGIVLSRIDRSFDFLMPIASGVSVLLAGMVAFSDIPSRFVIFDLAIAAILMILFFLRKKIKVHVKIRIVVIIVLALGILSIFYGGFSGSGIIVIIIGNYVAIAFLSKKNSIATAVITIASYIVIIVLLKLEIHVYTGYNSHLLNNNIAWLIQMGALTLLLVIVHISNQAIKRYLLESIGKVEESSKKIYHLAYYDSLTSLPNYNKFIQDIQLEPGVMILMDMKGLNMITSINGHDYGDQILKKLANIIIELKRPSDIVARMSDTMFGWWTSEVDMNEVEVLIHGALERIQSRMVSLDVYYRLEFHVGYAIYPNHATTIEDLYQKASRALENIKLVNKKRIMSYDEAIDQSVREEATISDALGSAILNEDFELYYQEKVAVTTQEVEGGRGFGKMELGRLWTYCTKYIYTYCGKEQYDDCFWQYDC